MINLNDNLRIQIRCHEWRIWHNFGSRTTAVIQLQRYQKPRGNILQSRAWAQSSVLNSWKRRWWSSTLCGSLMPLQYLVRLVSSQFILPLYTEFIYLIGLAKRADTAFDNMSVLQSHIRIFSQELGTIIAKHIETAHQKQFKPLIDNETSVSATQILMPLDKRKNYEMPKTRGPGIITDEEGQEWVPWDVISDDDNNLRDTETETKRRRERVEAVEVLRLFFLSFHSFFF